VAVPHTKHGQRWWLSGGRVLQIEEHMKVVNSSRWPKPEKIADFVTNGHL